MRRWRGGRTRRAPSILVSETKAVMAAANDDNNNAAGWLISNAHTLFFPSSLPLSSSVCLPASTMWAFQKESMVERDRDIKDICHVVSLCINIKKAEGRRIEKRGQREEEKRR